MSWLEKQAKKIPSQIGSWVVSTLPSNIGLVNKSSINYGLLSDYENEGLYSPLINKWSNPFRVNFDPDENEGKGRQENQTGDSQSF